LSVDFQGPSCLPHHKIIYVNSTLEFRKEGKPKIQ